MFVDAKARILRAKIVYYGPGLCGKTTNLEYIVGNLNKNVEDTSKKTELMSLATKGDRTIFFDYLPLQAQPIRGLKPVFQLFTVPGQVRYNRTRLIVLRGVDGVVFVVDSQPSLEPANMYSFKELLRNLKTIGLDPGDIPIIIQYNKQDLDEAIPAEVLEKKLKFGAYQSLPASAITGQNVMKTLRLVYDKVVERIENTLGPAKDGRPATSKTLMTRQGMRATNIAGSQSAPASKRKTLPPKIPKPSQRPTTQRPPGAARVSPDAEARVVTEGPKAIHPKAFKSTEITVSQLSQELNSLIAVLSRIEERLRSLEQTSSGRMQEIEKALQKLSGVVETYMAFEENPAAATRQTQQGLIKPKD